MLKNPYLIQLKYGGSIFLGPEPGFSAATAEVIPFGGLLSFSTFGLSEGRAAAGAGMGMDAFFFFLKQQTTRFGCAQNYTNNVRVCRSLSQKQMTSRSKKLRQPIQIEAKKQGIT